jgi:hypothetical protein
LIFTFSLIRFSYSSSVTTKSLHQELMERKQDADLVELWEKRRLLCEKQEADPMNVKKQK